MPISRRLLEPKSMNSKMIHTHLSKKREGQKRFYNRGSRPLSPLQDSRVVHLQTEKGHDRIGIIKRATAKPRSYLVESEGREYRRNRRHLLPVAETPPTAELDPGSPTDSSTEKDSIENVLNVPASPVRQPLAHTEHAPGQLRESPLQTSTEPSLARSRFGRLLKPNPKYSS